MHNSTRAVLHACYSRVTPQRFAAPRLLAYFPEVADLLGFAPDHCASEAFLQLCAGQTLLPGMDPYAMCYGGHQFGHWAGQLGDGRAITLGEILDTHGMSQSMQLKGAGPTPYSRRADGLAVLRSSLREFLCSEAMYHLGIPTTRALALVMTGETVMRDMFYDGHPREEPGAIVTRIAPSFLRFGNYQIFAARNDLATLTTLVEFTIKEYFPNLTGERKNIYLAWFREVVQTTINMVVHWQRVGFVHGVMNTDNMSILGLTIDYGPYGWLEAIEPLWTPNTTDARERRYCYANQPYIALWNLAQLASSIAMLVDETDGLQEIIDEGERRLETALANMWAAKLGLTQHKGSNDAKLIAELQAVFGMVEIDMTLFFRALAFVPKEADQLSDAAILAIISDAIYDLDNDLRKHRYQALLRWLQSYQARLRQERRNDVERKDAMDAVNPAFVLRNYLVQLAIDAAEQEDQAPLVTLMHALRTPYTMSGKHPDLLAKRPAWARTRAGCSMLSCSS